MMCFQLLFAVCVQQVATLVFLMDVCGFSWASAVGFVGKDTGGTTDSLLGFVPFAQVVGKLKKRGARDMAASAVPNAIRVQTPTTLLSPPPNHHQPPLAIKCVASTRSNAGSMDFTFRVQYVRDHIWADFDSG